MSKLPRPTGRDVVAALEKAGFEVARVRGSHHHMRDTEGHVTVVPVHAGETLGPGLLRRILRQAELSPRDLHELL